MLPFEMPKTPVASGDVGTVEQEQARALRKTGPQ